MKKIGILTHPLTENYGGILQAAVLYGYLEGKGYDVVLLRKHKYRPLWKNFLIFILERLPLQNIRSYRYLYKKRKAQESFINKYITKKTPILYKTEDLKKAANDYKLDAIVVGSDQVWKMNSIDDGYFESYFLNFVDSKKVRKIAYAASFGVDYWQDLSRVDEVKEYLNDFHAISLRESSGVDICKKTFGIEKCEHVLDPTMLVDSDFYKRFELKKNKTKPTVVTYFLDQNSNKDTLANQVLDIKGPGFDLVNLIDQKSNYIRRVDQWLNEIKSADFVVTDSFHGMVLSIVFKRDFLVIGNKKRGMARFESLLSLLGLCDRLINDNEANEIDRIISYSIDYDKINKDINILRESSIRFLNFNLM